jgi:hypothetical protein
MSCDMRNKIFPNKSYAEKIEQLQKFIDQEKSIYMLQSKFFMNCVFLMC